MLRSLTLLVPSIPRAMAIGRSRLPQLPVERTVAGTGRSFREAGHDGTTFATSRPEFICRPFFAEPTVHSLFQAVRSGYDAHEE